MNGFADLSYKQKQVERSLQINGGRRKLILTRLDFGSKLIGAGFGCLSSSIYPPSSHTAQILRDSYFS